MNTKDWEICPTKQRRKYEILHILDDKIITVYVPKNNGSMTILLEYLLDYKKSHIPALS